MRARDQQHRHHHHLVVVTMTAASIHSLVDSFAPSKSTHYPHVFLPTHSYVETLHFSIAFNHHHHHFLDFEHKMYTFRASNSQLTCRRWILDPEGCHDSRCPYLHAVTSHLSPPCPYACFAYNYGGCPKSQNECMYTHFKLDLPLNISAMCERTTFLRGYRTENETRPPSRKPGPVHRNGCRRCRLRLQELVEIAKTADCG